MLKFIGTRLSAREAVNRRTEDGVRNQSELRDRKPISFVEITLESLFHIIKIHRKRSRARRCEMRNEGNLEKLIFVLRGKQKQEKNAVRSHNTRNQAQA